MAYEDPPMMPEPLDKIEARVMALTTVAQELIRDLTTIGARINALREYQKKTLANPQDLTSDELLQHLTGWMPGGDKVKGIGLLCAARKFIKGKHEDADLIGAACAIVSKDVLGI